MASNILDSAVVLQEISSEGFAVIRVPIGALIMLERDAPVRIGHKVTADGLRRVILEPNVTNTEAPPLLDVSVLADQLDSLAQIGEQCAASAVVLDNLNKTLATVLHRCEPGVAVWTNISENFTRWRCAECGESGVLKPCRAESQPEAIQQPS